MENDEAKALVPYGAARDMSIKSRIFIVRGKQVMLDSDLAELYGVKTKVPNQAVRRDEARYPERFRFQLDEEELASPRAQGGDSDAWCDWRYNPCAFTEEGVAMLSAVPKGDTAVEVGIRIMDAFVEMHKFMMAGARLFEQVREIGMR